MNGNCKVKAREPATMLDCFKLVIQAEMAYDKKTEGWVRPSTAMIDTKDLDGSRRFLENVVRAWRG
jgi:hypothetical protein